MRVTGQSSLIPASVRTHTPGRAHLGTGTSWPPTSTQPARVKADLPRYLKCSQEILLHFGKHTEGICSGVERVSKHETRISMALSSLNQAVLMLGSRLSPKEAAV